MGDFDNQLNCETHGKSNATFICHHFKNQGVRSFFLPNPFTNPNQHYAVST